VCAGKYKILSIDEFGFLIHWEELTSVVVCGDTDNGRRKQYNIA